jgi:hypothetical protein
VLVGQLDELRRQQDRLRESAVIDLTVVVDLACAYGLRRKTHYGHEVHPEPPRKALQRVDQALTDWWEAYDKLKPEFDALHEKFEQINPEYLAALAVMDQWLAAAAARRAARAAEQS